MHLLIAALLSLGIGATLGMLGGGGSMLTLPMLLYVLDVTPNAAISASLCVGCLTSAASALAHARAGRVDWRAGAFFGVAGTAGAYGGGRLAHLVPGGLAVAGFALLMLVAAVLMLRRPRENAPAEPGGPRSLSVPRSICLGTGIGTLAGVLGAGGGFLIVPALEIGGGLALHEAIATSPVVTAIQSLAAFAGRFSRGAVDFELVAVISGISMVGCLGGALAARHVPARVLRRAFAFLLFALAILVLVKQLPAFR
jgi:uncharacterized membrane protein YfcA